METKVETKVVNNRNNKQKGVTTVEYAIMLVIVAIAVAAGTPGISDAVLGAFGDAAACLTGACN